MTAPGRAARLVVGEEPTPRIEHRLQAGRESRIPAADVGDSAHLGRARFPLAPLRLERRRPQLVLAALLGLALLDPHVLASRLHHLARVVVRLPGAALLLLLGHLVLGDRLLRPGQELRTDDQTDQTRA